jgi:hypothetical protein
MQPGGSLRGMTGDASALNRPEADAAVEGEKKKREGCRNEETSGQEKKLTSQSAS